MERKFPCTFRPISAEDARRIGDRIKRIEAAVARDHADLRLASATWEPHDWTDFD